MIIEQYGHFIFDNLFEKMYLSHHLHMRKPDPAIFRSVLKENGLKDDETCFIDDSLQHVQGSRSVGITAFHLDKKSLIEFFKTENENGWGF